MASSTLMILDETNKAEDEKKKITKSTTLDMSKTPLTQGNSEEFKLPKRISSPRLSGSPRELKKSPRYVDLTQITVRESPPREEEFKDVKKHEELVKKKDNDVVGRKRSSGNFSGFKVVKIESPRARKNEETRVDESPQISPRK